MSIHIGNTGDEVEDYNDEYFEVSVSQADFDKAKSVVNCLSSILYPYAEGKTFDIAYYESKHLPMVAGFLGTNLVKYAIEKGLASGIPNTPLPYMVLMRVFYAVDIDI